MMFFVSTVWTPFSVRTWTRPGPLDGRRTPDHVNLVLPHQEVYALGVLVDDLVLVVDCLGIIQARVVAEDAVAAAIFEVLPQVGRVEQGLGGDAADEQAGPAQARGFLDERGAQAVLSGSHRRGIAARPASDN